jgi:uncharacterized DUF497 family protein
MLVKEIYSITKEDIMAIDKYTYGDFSVEDIVKNVNEKKWKAVGVFDDGMMVGSVVFMLAKNRKCYIFSAAGKHITSKDNWNQFITYLKEQGIKTVSAGMRDSTLRLWRQFGFEKKYSVAEVDL